MRFHLVLLMLPILAAILTSCDEDDPAPVAEPAAEDPAPMNPAPTNPAPTNPAPTNPAPMNPPPMDPVPTDPVPDASNEVPTFSSSPIASVEENSSGTIYTATATDAEDDALTFAISGGIDAGLFSVSPSGELSFNDPPDFENPIDTDQDNIYELTLTVSDANGSASLNVTLTVTDVNEPFSVRRLIEGLDLPLFVLGTRDGTGRVFVLEKDGVILILDPDTGTLAPQPFLDISSEVANDGERGLLGMALAPDYETSGEFYVHISNRDGDSEIRRYSLSATDSDQADSGSADIILEVVQPASNHNGGWLDFGLDRFLYIALGDGGGSNDPFGNGQDTDTLLGTILRIDPSSDDFPSDDTKDYAIPSDNPFVGVSGADEIYAYGLRNPFRASFDTVSGALLIGDVGQADIEEISLINPGEAALNFGWPILEGTRMNMAGSTVGFTPPVAEYPHGISERTGNSVTGGYVYRGPIQSLQGKYIFADFANANIWSIEFDDIVQGQTIGANDFTIENSTFQPDEGRISSISSLGVDDAGNIYFVDIGGEVFRAEP
ncbi:MAG: PQQ-dependent sugar dehydrogenase [Pseudomonadota bacterium]